MAATLNVYVGFECVANGVRTTGGSIVTPTVVTLATGVKHEQVFSLAATDIKEILRVGTAAGDDIPDFDFLYIVASLPGQLEIWGTAEEDNSSVKLAANVPFILGVDDTRNYAAATRSGEASQNITKIWFKPDAVTAMTVYVFAAT